MKRIHSFAVLAAALSGASLGAQQPAPQRATLDRIVAVVGDQPITRFDLEQRMLQDQQRGMRPPTDSAALKAYQAQALNTMIDEELLLQKAKELKVDVPDNEIASTVDRQIRDIKARFTTESEFRTELAKAGLGTPEEYRRMLSDQMKRDETIKRTMQKLREENKVIPANVTEDEVKEAFERSRASLPRRPAQVTFRQIVIAPRPTAAAKEVARVKAESILAEIKKGADFEKVAKRESMHLQSKEMGGDLGWARRGDNVPEFDRWLFGSPFQAPLAPGQL